MKKKEKKIHRENKDRISLGMIKLDIRNKEEHVVKIRGNVKERRGGARKSNVE